MSRSVKLFGHPVHQMLVAFPLGLLGASVIFDLVQLWRVTNWSLAATYMIGGGILGGLIAAAFGLADWMGIPAGTRAKRIGLLHAVGNVIVLGIFAVDLALRRENPASPPGISVAIGVAGLALAGVTGWLGGELVDRLGVGVDAGAHLDARSSLKGPIVTRVG